MDLSVFGDMLGVPDRCPGGCRTGRTSWYPGLWLVLDYPAEWQWWGGAEGGALLGPTRWRETCLGSGPNKSLGRKEEHFLICLKGNEA